MFTKRVKIPKKVPKIVKEFATIILQAGFQCFLVGGAVRNMVIDLQVFDYDIATDAYPEQIMKLFHRVIPTGIKHGTVTVLYKKTHFEVTTFRVEGDYSDNRRPDSVSYTPSINQDLKRRDFTINAIAFDLRTCRLIDPQNGISDIQAKIIRAIGDPNQRFSEDALRMLRACRFAAQLQFIIDDKTFQGIRKNRNSIESVSAERIRDELIKIILSEKPTIGLNYMERTGLLAIILPELHACKGIPQKGQHKFDVYTHSITACEMAENDVVIRLSGLLHDIGKPVTLDYRNGDEPTFYRHEEASAEMARDILKRYRFPKAIEQKVSHLILNHMFHYTSSWSDAAVRRFAARIGRNYINDLFKLRIADQRGMTGEIRPNPSLDELKERLSTVASADAAFSIQDLDIDGDLLADKAGVPRGPEMGDVLHYLFEAVLDDPNLNKKAILLNLGENYYREYIKKPSQS